MMLTKQRQKLEVREAMGSSHKIETKLSRS